VLAIGFPIPHGGPGFVESWRGIGLFAQLISHRLGDQVHPAVKKLAEAFVVDWPSVPLEALSADQYKISASRDLRPINALIIF
jgi:hypothetical protein